MVMLVGEAVRRLRDNEAGLVQLEGLRGEKGPEMSEAEVRGLAGALAVNTILTMLDLVLNALGKKGGRCLLYTSPSPRDATLSRMPSSA